MQIMSPHDEMSKLDADGRAYVITGLSAVGQKVVSRQHFNVLFHSEHWLRIHKDDSPTAPLWVNMQHIIGLAVVPV